MAKKPKAKKVGTNTVYHTDVSDFITKRLDPETETERLYIMAKEIALFPVSEKEFYFNKITGLIRESEDPPNESKNRTFWEITRSRPEYLELCKEFDFNKITGLISGKWLKVENHKKFFRAKDRARELWGIGELVDPRKEYSELQPDIVNLFGVAPKLVTALSPYGEYPFIQDGRYVILKIDISEPYDYIEPLIKVHLDHFRGQVKQKGGRGHYKKQLEYLKVWNERKKKVPFKTIASNLKITVELAKKRFYKAFELIMGKRYDQELFKNIKIHKTEIRKTCDNCLDKECLKSFKKGGSWEPCPDVAYFFYQDQVKRRELRKGDLPPKAEDDG